MSAQTIKTVRRKRQIGVMGGSGLEKDWGGGGLGPPDYGMGSVQSGDLTGLALGLGRAGGGVGTSQIGGGLGPIGATPREVERIPAKAEATEQYGDHGDTREDRRQPPERRQAAKNYGGTQGNTRRSSSKCGPSLRVGQSPPHTMATPRPCAAAFTASAMRG